MSYLSRIQLNRHSRKFMIGLNNPNIIHGIVQSAMPDKYSKALWRIDFLYGHPYLLICSEEMPKLEVIQDQIGYPDFPGEIKGYDKFLNSLRNGQRWHFRLQANPVLSALGEGDARGKRVAHKTIKYQRAWLADRAAKWGFKLDPDSYDVVSEKWCSFKKKKDQRRITFLSVCFEGILEITDAELFRQTLTRGVGKEKAYGQGLLTVAGKV